MNAGAREQHAETPDARWLRSDGPRLLPPAYRLKYQDSDPTRPKDPHFGHTTYPEVMRHAPRKIWPWAVKEEVWPGPMPLNVPWTSGVLAPADAKIVSSEPNDRWRERWCKKHGPC